ncbi:phage tail tape measure protein [Cumulibacter soli]|uniref:phage tail tape measure protein n=1 Tax=Cumulibacter soli TaxID=2546344 RepID=UPI0010677EFC|nr:phage tail tape measure protein [Cumulibacter soli]
MATVGTLAYILTADNGELLTKLQQSDQAIAQTTGRAETQGSKLRSGLAKAFSAAAIVGFVKDTFTAGAQYQQSMNQFQAASGATAKEMDQAAKSALALGNSTLLPAASAKDAGTAMEILAKGGLSASDSMAAAEGTLLLAAAAGTDAASAAELTADSLNAFGLSGDQASKVANTLAGAANAATGEISDFGQGLAQVGSVAHSFGISVDDTVTSLAAMAQAGIKGSDAGTSLKSMLLALASPTKQQAAALEQLGVSAYDASGEFVGMEKLSGQLASAQGRLTREQFNAAASTAFGTDAMRAAVAMAGQGADGFDELADKVTKAGNAQALAEAKSKGLSGALASLQSAFETAQLEIFTQTGGQAEDVIRRLTDIVPDLVDGLVEIASAAASVGLVGLNGFVSLLQAASPLISVVGTLADLFSDLPEPLQAAAAAALLLSRRGDAIAKMGTGAATGIKTIATNARDVGPAFMQAYGYARAGGEGITKSVMSAATGTTRAAGIMKGAMRGLTGAFGGPLGLAVTAGITLLSLFQESNQDAAAAQQANADAARELADALDQSNGVLDANVAKVAQTQLLKKREDATYSLIEANNKLGLNESDLIVAYAQGGKQLDDYASKMLSANKAKNSMLVADKGGNFHSVLTDEGEAIEANIKQLAGMGSEMEATKGHSDALSDAQGELSGATSDAAGEAQLAADAFNAQAEAIAAAQKAADDAAAAALDLSAAQRSYQSALDDANASLAEHGATLDIDTEAGRANQAALDDIAKSANDTAAAMAANGSSITEVTASQKDARAALIDTAISFGMTADEAKAYADQVISIPDYSTTLVTMPGVLDATAQADLLASSIIDAPDEKTIVTTALTADTVQQFKDLGFEVEQIPGTKMLKISDNGPEAEARIGSVVDMINSGMPEEIVTELTLTGVQSVEGAIDAIDGKATLLSDGTYGVTVEAPLLPEVEEQLNALGLQLETLEDGTQVLVAVEGDEVAQADLDAVIEKAGIVDLTDPNVKISTNSAATVISLEGVGVKTTTLPNGVITISDNSPETINKLSKLNLKTVTLDDGTVVVTDNSGTVISNLDDIDLNTTTLSDGSVKITDNAGNVIANLETLNQKQVNDKSYTVTEYRVVKGLGAGLLGGGGAAAGGVYQGGYRFMAGGGVPSVVDGHRVSGRRPSLSLAAGARMLQPGTNQIVSGDRMDVEEAFIPLDMSARSMDVLDYAARASGKVLADPGQQGGSVTVVAPQTTRGGDTKTYNFAITQAGGDPRETAKAIRRELELMDYLDSRGDR